MHIETLTCREAAAELGCHESSIVLYCQSGELEAYQRVKGSPWVITRPAFDAFKVGYKKRAHRPQPLKASRAKALAANGGGLTEYSPVDAEIKTHLDAVRTLLEGRLEWLANIERALGVKR